MAFRVTVSAERNKQQLERFRILLSYMREAGLYQSNIQLCNEVGINRSHLSTTLNDKSKCSPMGIAMRVCEHYKLPYLTWIETGEGQSPVTQYENGAKYIGYLDESDTIESKLLKPFSPVVLPSNIDCDIVFVYRGKMYFVVTIDIFNKFIDTGTRYFIELDNKQKFVKRLSEQYTKETRMISFIDPDNSHPTFELPIGKIASVYRIIATLEFNQ